MSNTFARSSSSPGVSRSNNSVANPARCSTPATYRLRGLCRLLPLPCTNTTRPRAPAGTVRCPASRAPPGGHLDLLVDDPADRVPVDLLGRSPAATVGTRDRRGGPSPQQLPLTSPSEVGRKSV